MTIKGINTLITAMTYDKQGYLFKYYLVTIGYFYAYIKLIASIISNN